MIHQTPTVPQDWELKKSTYRVRAGNMIWMVANGQAIWFKVEADSELIDLGVDMFPAVIRKVRRAPNSTEIRRDARAHVARTVRKLRKSLGMPI